MCERLAIANLWEPALQEPDYTVFTDRVRSCEDYVWYTGDNLNANSALHVRCLAVS